MSDWDFIGTLDIISSGKNPEIWHVHNNTHPGIGWSIKTVIPKPQFWTIETKPIIQAWADLCAKQPALVTWTDDAFDWDGNNLHEWQTMWVKDRFDVVPEDIQGEGIPMFKLITQIKGEEPIIKLIIDNLRLQQAQSNNAEDKVELSRLLEIAETLISQVSDTDIKNRRRNLRIVDKE